LKKDRINHEGLAKRNYIYKIGKDKQEIGIKKMRQIIAVFLLSFNFLLFADSIQLKDGSKIMGTLDKIKDDKVLFNTEFAGTLTIDVKNVASLQTDKEQHIVLKSDTAPQKTILSSALLPGNELGNIQISHQEENIQEIAALWNESKDNPYLGQWNGKVYLDISGKEGNTDKYRQNFGFSATRKSAFDKLKIYYQTTYAEENGDKNEDETLYGADYEHNIKNTPHSWYARIESEEDEISGIDHRYEAVIGYGYFLIKRKATTLRTRCGIAYWRLETKDATTDNIGLDLNLFYEHVFDQWGRWETSVTYAQSINNTEVYRIYHESFWELPLKIQIPISLRLGMSNEYYNITSEDAEHLDTTYFAKIVYSW